MEVGGAAVVGRHRPVQEEEDARLPKDLVVISLYFRVACTVGLINKYEGFFKKNKPSSFAKQKVKEKSVALGYENSACRSIVVCRSHARERNNEELSSKNRHRSEFV